MTDRTPTGDTPTHGIHVIPGEVPEGVVPPSTSMRPPQPTGDLCGRLAEALEPVTVAATPAEVIARHMDGLDREAIVPSPSAFTALVEAVLPVVEAETAALRQRAVKADDRAEAAGYEATSARLDLREAERQRDEQRERADQAEASLAATAHLLEHWIDKHMILRAMDGTEVHADWCFRCRVERAEDAVQRVRDLVHAANQAAEQALNRSHGGAPFPASIPAADVLTAIDQPKEAQQ